MKREDIIDSMEYIEEDYIREADRSRSTGETAGNTGKVTAFPGKTPDRSVQARKWGMLAASLALLVVAAFVITGVLRIRSGNMNTMQTAEVAEAEDAQAAPELNKAAEAPAAEPEYGVGGAAAAEPEYDVGEAAAEEPDYAADEMAAAEENVLIRVRSDAGEVVFALNDTPAAQSLAAMLPLSADTETYSDNEIIFHPEEPLDTENGMEGGGTAGCLGYFAPWNNVVMYYGGFEEYPGLYILGEAVSGAENIENIRGTVTLELIDEAP